MTVYWIVTLLLIFGVLAYHQASASVHLLAYTVFLIFMFDVLGVTVGTSITFLILAATFLFLVFAPVRRAMLTKHIFKLYKKIMPSMSATEREAISAGTVGWEGELFNGNPNWQRLIDIPVTTLTDEEKAFLDGPVEALCGMLNDWEITHVHQDLPQNVWEFIRSNGFLGIIIPKQYGGKEFSAYAHSEIITKIGGVSITAGTTVSVPNSLGPAELLLHYGTEEQKSYYLPRLARGEEIPCFALTSPLAGSDASSLTDYGIVCRGKFAGEDVLGIRLTFNKRYITLAPVATLIGLAFKLYDPDQLLSSKKDVGITCALIPRDTPGIQIGRRHFPLNAAFQNGPISGNDVFIPLDWVIGGVEQVGKGWRMLMECLAAGRAISLPSIAIAGAKVATFSTSVYARIRRQFNLPIGKFEGVQEPLARMAAFTYMADAARRFTCMMVDQGQKPAVASAMVKYHVTELGRKIGHDAMDVHGGKGICLGPNNYLGRGYQAAPIAITVEGANILTRNMIIFGQGVLRCHPYLLKELLSANDDNHKNGLIAFDKALFQHIGYAMGNLIRTFFLGVTSGFGVRAPNTKLKRYYQQATRFSAALAIMTEVSLGMYGASLKRKESISARLGDIHSYLYLLSSVFKQYHLDQDQDHLPVARYAALYCLFEIQERFSELLRNMPNRWVYRVLRVIIFPWGERFTKPRDKIMSKIAKMLLDHPRFRYDLSQGIYLPNKGPSLMAQLNDAINHIELFEEVDHIIHQSLKDESLEGYAPLEHAQSALSKGLITDEQYKNWLTAYEKIMKVIHVDDFDPSQLIRDSKHHYHAHQDTSKT